MDTEGTSLDELLNGPTEAIAEDIVPQEPETIGQPRGEDGKFLSTKEETGVETPPVAQEPRAEPVPPTEPGLPPEEYKALKDERRKRQEAEARIAALERDFQARQQAKPPEPEVDFWDDPNAVISQRVEQAVSTALQRIEQQQLTKRIDDSEQVARQKYTDFDEKLGAFQQAVQFNPILAREMAMASDPAAFAYERGRTALEIQRAGSLDEVLKAERAKWEAEALAAMPAPPTLPSTTATDGSVGGRSGPAWAGPPSIDDLLR